MPHTLHRGDDTYTVADRLPVLPLRDLIVFPYVATPLLVGRAASLAAVEAAATGDQCILLVAQRSGDVTEPVAGDLFRVGVIARVLQVAKLANGTTKVLVEGVARARVTRYAPAGPFLKAVIAPEPYTRGTDPTEEEALARRLVERFEEYVTLHRRLPDELVGLVREAETAERQAFGVAAHLFVRLEQRQQLLESPSLQALITRLSELLAGETELLRLERKIEEDVRGSLFQNQREFYLQEQLKAIHRELGQDDTEDLDELEAQLAAKGLPETVAARAVRELRRLRRMSPLSPESTVARTFVDWVLALPWTERTDDVVDVAHARAVLDADHYGLEEVKERILDYIAVLGLVGRLDGPILCLVGPPGVGKTSLGRSIARALGRRFVRMSLGGVRDEAEIRGHRRTYVGAMPGRVLQAMRRAEVVNPVILLDEIDKLGHDYRGDPAAALLEVLDPEQNRTFSDHYLEVDYDLSQVLFVTTANSLGQIPDALRDRLEIIRIPGYLEPEKLAIARQFLAPKQLRLNGIDPARVQWDDAAMKRILREYTREAGVRELERRLARVARKLARRLAETSSVAPIEGIAPAVLPDTSPDAPATPGAEAAASPLAVRGDELPALLGTPPYDPDETIIEDKVGVATGLAYTSVGGETLEIEAIAVPGRGKLQLTGTLGDVMKESASAALSYMRSRAAALGIDREFYRTRDLHVHIPAGATPKDGPSAGIAIATAVVSALTRVPVRGDVAMTGEITLRGRVLPIGGLKEKAVAAQRNGVTHVIIPHGNAREVPDLPAEIRSSVQFHPVRSMDEVLTLALRTHVAAGDAASASPMAH